MKKKFLLPLLSLCLLCSCEKPDSNDENLLGKPLDKSAYSGLYILSEGVWMGNNARLDFYDYASGVMNTDVYSAANPQAVLSLGSTANDLKAYNGRLYAVLNGSNKVEVTNLQGLSLGKVDVEQPRAICFMGNYGYVTSYADGGSVVRFNINTLQPDLKVTVGPEPEGICAANGKLYVAMSAWSQAYTSGYDNTVAVVNPSDLSVKNRIEVAINLKYIEADNDGKIWVTSVGDYADIPSALYVIDPKSEKPQYAGVAATRFALNGDKVYYYNASWDNAAQEYIVNYGTLDRKTLAPGQSFISDGSDKSIANAYGLAVNPDTGHVFLADSKGYTVEGELRVYDADGKLITTVSTGICPAHMAVVRNNQ